MIIPCVVIFVLIHFMCKVLGSILRYKIVQTPFWFAMHLYFYEERLLLFYKPFASHLFLYEFIFFDAIIRPFL